MVCQCTLTVEASVQYFALLHCTHMCLQNAADLMLWHACPGAATTDDLEALPTPPSSPLLDPIPEELHKQDHKYLHPAAQPRASSTDPQLASTPLKVKTHACCVHDVHRLASLMLCNTH